MEASKIAATKNLGIVAGTQRRHQPPYVETIKRRMAKAEFLAKLL